MAGEARQIGAERVHVDGHPADRLGAVHVEDGAGGVDQFGDRRHVLHDADLVVRQEHGDEERVRPECRLEIGEPDPPRHAACVVLEHDREPGHLGSLAFEVFHGIEHGVVLGRHRHDVPGKSVRRLEPRMPRGRSEDGEVGALGGPAREHDLPRIGGNRVGERAPRGFHRLTGLAAHVVRHAAGVAVAVGEPRQHRLQHPRIKPRCGVVVEINGALQLGHILSGVYHRESRRG